MNGGSLLLVLGLIVFVGIMFFRLFRNAATQLSAARTGPAAWEAAAPALGLEVGEPGKLYLRGMRDGRAVTVIGDRIEKRYGAFDLTAPRTSPERRQMKEFWTTTEIAFAQQRAQKPDLADLPAPLAVQAKAITDSGANLRALSTGLVLSRPGVSETPEALERDIAMVSDLARAIEAG